MNTRKCKRCGWEVPATQRSVACPICKEPYDEVYCHKCGRIVSGRDRVPKRALCRECHNAEEREHMRTYNQRQQAKFEERFNSWLDKIRAVPKSYPTLTEEQWMEACKHFNGCARCGSQDITARGFFIGFEIGGRYCDWNIIPLCDKCAKSWDLTLNTFRVTRNKDNISRSQEYRRCLERIVDYLGGKLDGAVHFTEEA